MSKTELSTYVLGGGEYGAGSLRSILEGEDWRAALDIDIEAKSEQEVRDIAEEIVDNLSEMGEIDEVEE